MSLLYSRVYLKYLTAIQQLPILHTETLDATVFRGGFRPRATRAMARGSAQKIFFSTFSNWPSPTSRRRTQPVVRPCPSPQPRRRLSRTRRPRQPHATTRIRPSPQRPSPQASASRHPPAQTGDAARRPTAKAALGPPVRPQAPGAGRRRPGPSAAPPPALPLPGSGRRQPAAGTP